MGIHSDVVVATGQNNRNSAAFPTQLHSQALQAGLAGSTTLRSMLMEKSFAISAC